jgi:hypothetical protein
MAELDDDAPIDLPDGASPVEWAKSVLWAAENVNVTKMTKAKAGSLARYIYWQQGRKNAKQLLIDFVPRALKILDQNSKNTSDVGGMAASEAEDIAELEELLRDAIVEAGVA